MKAAFSMIVKTGCGTDGALHSTSCHVTRLRPPPQSPLLPPVQVEPASPAVWPHPSARTRSASWWPPPRISASRATPASIARTRRARGGGGRHGRAANTASRSGDGGCEAGRGLSQATTAASPSSGGCRRSSDRVARRHVKCVARVMCAATCAVSTE